MTVLMLSTDQKILETGSEAQKRMKNYGTVFEKLHIVVYTRRLASYDQQPVTVDNNVFIYPTNTRFKPFYYFDVYKIVESLVASRKSLVVTAQDPFETGLAGWLLKLKYRLPLQIQVHTDFLSPYFWQESLKNKLRFRLAKFLLPRADGIRVVSERVKKSLLIAGLKLQNEPVVLPIFVDVKKIQAAKIKTDLRKKYRDYDFIILMASRLTKEKNISLAIEAFADAKRQLLSPKNPLLLIVGDGPELKNLQLTTYNLQLENNIRFEPWTEDLISYYKTAGMFLSVSDYEGYGRTVIEAMAAGLPMIMTDVGLAGEILIDDLSGIITPVRNKISLAKAIILLLKNKEKRKIFSRESQKASISLGSKEKYLSLYQDSLYKVSRHKQRLAYVLPRYQKRDATHFVYISDFLREISGKFSIFLIIEKGSRPPQSPANPANGASGAGGAQPLRDLGCQRVGAGNILWRLLHARFLGYEDFYVHYSFRAAFFASLVVKAFGGRVFYWNCGEPWKYRRHFIREFFERSVYRLITFLVTGTDSLAEEYSKYYGIPLSKIKIMPNWIDLANIIRRQATDAGKESIKNKLNIHSGAKIALFAHRLSKRKGAHYLPEILDQLKNEDIVMIVIGDGPEKAAVESKIKNYGLSRKVRFLGWVPNQEVLQYYVLADVFLMPSEEEGFPHVLLEAMAMGTPFAASDVGGVKEMTPQASHKYIAASGDVDKFVRVIKELLAKKPKELSDIKKVLTDWVRRYDIKLVSEDFVEIVGTHSNDNP